MKVSLNWLRELVELPPTVPALVDRFLGDNEGREEREEFLWNAKNSRYSARL